MNPKMACDRAARRDGPFHSLGMTEAFMADQVVHNMKTMFDDVLIPTDGSDGVDAAIGYGLDLARTAGATIHTLYVVDTRFESGDLAPEVRTELRSRSKKRGRMATNTIQQRSKEHDLATVREIRTGIPYRTIVEYVEEQDIDLVVMATLGQAGPEFGRLGSTTERVITLADVPVLAVHPGADGEIPERYTMYNQIVIPTDGSDAAERAAGKALDFAEHYGADVHAVYVVDTTIYDLQDAPRSIVGLLKEGGQEAVEAIADDARERNLPVTADVLRGIPEEEIRDYVDGVDADLLVMGTRGRGAGPDRLLGSTTARVLRRTETPVLTIG